MFCVVVKFKVMFIHHFHNSFTGLVGYVRTVVEHAGDSPHGITGFLCNILDGNSHRY